jgi:hypothetical protein
LEKKKNLKGKVSVYRDNLEWECNLIVLLGTQEKMGRTLMLCLYYYSLVLSLSLAFNCGSWRQN